MAPEPYAVKEILGALKMLTSRKEEGKDKAHMLTDHSNLVLHTPRFDLWRAVPILGQNTPQSW